ncbi:MAG: ATP-dependent Clp protease proteolytic subunit [Anaerolineae bacterium]|nr:ATP-dependent Clp protease proteolytic subunit [Anaerolineae bacterium]
MYRFDEDDDEPQEPVEKPEENNDQPEKPGSPFDRLMKTRTITIFGEINMKKAQDVTQQLLLLAADSDEPIKVFINSPGGHVESGDTIFDMIRFIKPKVKVIGTGWVASAGALIYAAADKENRYSLPNTRFLLHQPAGGAMGQASDIAIEATEIIKMRRRLNQIFADQTGQPLAKVEKDTDRNFWMSAKEAQEYGLVGKIIQSVGELE